MKYIFLSVIGALLLTPSIALASYSWPTPTDISASLSSTTPPSGSAFEPSDIAITSSGVVLVSDEGDVALMGDDGTGLSEWLIATNADLEGVAVSDDALYVLHERDRDVYVYDLTSYAYITTFDLSAWISGSDNLGPEGIAVHESTMYIGDQATGTVYEFDISSGSPSLTTSWSTGIWLSAISYADDGNLYAMGSGVLRAYAADHSYVEYTLPAHPQPEGVALRVDCSTSTASLFIANDTGPVYRYDDFPVTCPVETTSTSTSVDADADGVADGLDCNDADATVSSLQTYYRDADSDTLGSSTDTTDVCSAVAPSGYVTNSSDLNDAQAYFSASGTVDGSIIVTYGDGSSSTYQVYAMTTARVISTVNQYKDSAYLIVIAPFGRRVAVVDPYTGAVVAMRSMPRNKNVLAAWFVSIIGY